MNNYYRGNPTGGLIHSYLNTLQEHKYAKGKVTNLVDSDMQQ